MLSSLSLHEFFDLLGSDAPAPGGGSVAALHGALGAALDAMVCSLTLGRQKYADYAAFAAEQLTITSELKARFLAAMDEDNAVFTEFSATLSLPKVTEDEKAQRSAAMQEALIKCTKSPLAIMELAADALQLTKRLLGKTNRLAVSDIGVAAISLRACIQSAWLNVKINLGSLRDEALTLQFRERGTSLLAQALPLADEIITLVEEAI